MANALGFRAVSQYRAAVRCWQTPSLVMKGSPVRVRAVALLGLVLYRASRLAAPSTGRGVNASRAPNRYRPDDGRRPPSYPLALAEADLRALLATALGDLRPVAALLATLLGDLRAAAALLASAAFPPRTRASPPTEGLRPLPRPLAPGAAFLVDAVRARTVAAVASGLPCGSLTRSCATSSASVSARIAALEDPSSPKTTMSLAAL